MCGGATSMPTSSSGTLDPKTAWQYVSGAVSPANTGAKAYKITADADATYEFSMCTNYPVGGSASADFDVYICLYDSSGTTVTYNDDYCGQWGPDSLSSYISTALTTGTYWMVVSAYASNSGNFNMGYRKGSATQPTPTSTAGSSAPQTPTLPVGPPQVTPTSNPCVYTGYSSDGVVWTNDNGSATHGGTLTVGIGLGDFGSDSGTEVTITWPDKNGLCPQFSGITYYMRIESTPAAPAGDRICSGVFCGSTNCPHFICLDNFNSNSYTFTIPDNTTQLQFWTTTSDNSGLGYKYSTVDIMHFIA
jgi:hypothetical protein